MRRVLRVVFLAVPLLFTSCVPLSSSDQASSDEGIPVIGGVSVKKLSSFPATVEGLEGVATYLTLKVTMSDGRVLNVSDKAEALSAPGLLLSRTQVNGDWAWKIQSFSPANTKIIWRLEEIEGRTIETSVKFEKAKIESLKIDSCRGGLIPGMEYYPNLEATLDNGQIKDVTSMAAWSVYSGQSSAILNYSARPSVKPFAKGEFVLRASLEGREVFETCSVREAVITNLKISFSDGLNSQNRETFSGTRISINSQIEMSDGRILLNSPHVIWPGFMTVEADGRVSFLGISLTGEFREQEIKATLHPNAGVSFVSESNLLTVKTKTVKPVSLEIAQRRMS